MLKKSGGVKAGYLLGAILLLALIGSSDAWAQPACRVLDPTGTPLNVRTVPNGTILSTAPNGLPVAMIDRATDRAGKLWVYVADVASGRPIGWVFRQFIDCRPENNMGQLIIAAQHSQAGPASWCAQETSARGAVICADRRLWDLTQIRNQLFAAARAKMSPEDYRILLDEQKQWVQSYSRNCGVAGDKSSLSLPIDPAIIQCFLTASTKRNAELMARIEGGNAAIQVPPPAAPGNDLEKARKALAEKEKAEAEAAQRRRQEEASRELERLHAQAAADKEANIRAKLSGLGFKLITPIDLDLDWKKLADDKVKIALRGTYVSNDGVEALSVQDKVNPLLRLYTDNAARNARKLLLECQEGENACPVIIGAEVSVCTRNEGKITETDVPCLQVLNAFEDN